MKLAVPSSGSMIQTRAPAAPCAARLPRRETRRRGTAPGSRRRCALRSRGRRSSRSRSSSFLRSSRAGDCASARRGPRLPTAPRRRRLEEGHRRRSRAGALRNASAIAFSAGAPSTLNPRSSGAAGAPSDDLPPVDALPPGLACERAGDGGDRPRRVLAIRRPARRVVVRRDPAPRTPAISRLREDHALARPLGRVGDGRAARRPDSSSAASVSGWPSRSDRRSRRRSRRARPRTGSAWRRPPSSRRIAAAPRGEADGDATLRHSFSRVSVFCSSVPTQKSVAPEASATIAWCTMKRRYDSNQACQPRSSRIATSPTPPPPPTQICGLTSVVIPSVRASDSARTSPSSVSPRGLRCTKRIGRPPPPRGTVRNDRDRVRAKSFARSSVVRTSATRTRPRSTRSWRRRCRAGSRRAAAGGPAAGRPAASGVAPPRERRPPARRAPRRAPCRRAASLSSRAPASIHAAAAPTARHRRHVRADPRTSSTDGSTPAACVKAAKPRRRAPTTGRTAARRPRAGACGRASSAGLAARTRPRRARARRGPARRARRRRSRRELVVAR